MRFEGVVKSWNDDRGFGFIEPTQGGQAIFVHIKAFPAGTGRPTPNLNVSFQVETGKDGKKRAMFALTNFLTLAGWSPEMIELRLNEWNKVNPEPLREVILNGHMRTVRMKRERFPPPSCRGFYQELGVCFPDDMCNVIKNPVQYVKRKASFIAPKKTARKKAIEKEQPASDVADGVAS